MKRLTLARNVKGDGGWGWYVESEGGGKVGRVRCCEGVVARSMKIRRRMPRPDELDWADEGREEDAPPA